MRRMRVSGVRLSVRNMSFSCSQPEDLSERLLPDSAVAIILE